MVGCFCEKCVMESGIARLIPCMIHAERNQGSMWVLVSPSQLSLWPCLNSNTGDILSEITSSSDKRVTFDHSEHSPVAAGVPAGEAFNSLK